VLMSASDIMSASPMRCCTVFFVNGGGGSTLSASSRGDDISAVTLSDTSLLQGSAWQQPYTVYTQQNQQITKHVDQHVHEF